MTNPIKLINGYECRTCNECKRDINLNSMKDENICNTCYEYTTVVKKWEVIEGDYNDVYKKIIIHTTAKEIEIEVRDYFSKDALIEDLGSDSIGYGILNRNGQYDYYVEAREIEE